jgi:hypothetical protein
MVKVAFSLVWKLFTCESVPGAVMVSLRFRDTLETSVCAVRLFPTAEGP